MIYQLKKGEFAIAADTFGAELHSIKLGGLEYLWQCGDAWKRYAPILFPFICSPENREYRAGGKQYKMRGNHGFARDMEFELSGKDDKSLSFLLRSDDDTMSQYPYAFEFTVKYTLLDNGVEVRHIVRNTDDKPIYFYIGGHPAFNCPLEDGKNFNDYFVEYENNEHITRNREGTAETVVENGRILKLSRELFDFDSLVLPSPNSKKVTLRSEGSERSVTVEFPQSKCITVWSPTGDDRAAFVCLEPWTSVPTYFDDSEPDIEKKAHAIKLKPENDYEYAYSIYVK